MSSSAAAPGSSSTTLDAHPPVANSPAPLFTLTGSIRRRRIPIAYRLTLALTALVMVLLPLIYITLIVATGYGVYLWAIYGTFLFSEVSAGLIKLLLYIAPLFAGVTLIAFMIKPLFARPATRPEPLTLDLARYSELHDLIAAVCAQVGAPMPVRVDVDCQVNAAASLRRGVLSLGRKDLVLTIGLPLVQGLTARQLAGVLAHEFGHFAQGAGMALSYIIRLVNAWFARVVYQRDEWDANLARWSEEGDYRVRLVVALARGAVWLSRKCLHGLMLFGHAVACLQLRQMEYDADYYEVAFAGSAEFVATGREIHRLAAANQAAFHDLGELWQSRQLVADFPDLVAAKRSHFDAGSIAKIDQHATASKTRWLDTHPAHADRNAAALRLALPGVLRCDAPAASFFPDLSDLARAATRRYYSAELGLNIDESSLVPAEKARIAATSASASDAARVRLVGAVLDLSRPVLWQATDFTPRATTTLNELGVALAATRAEIDRLRTSAERESVTYTSVLNDLLLLEQAHALLSAGVKVKPRHFHLTKSDLGEAESERAHLRQRLAAKASDLRPFETSVHTWVSLIGQAARAPSLPLSLAPDARAELVQLTESLAALSPWFGAFPDWHIQYLVLTNFLGNQEALGGNSRFATALQSHLDAAIRTADAAPSLVGDAPFPLPMPDGPVTAANLLRGTLEGVQGAARLAVALETVAKFYFRILTRIIALGEDVEKSLSAAGATT